jgi:hypothetical protein
MVNKTTPLDLKTIRPGTASTFDPVFEVEDCEGRGRKNGDYIYATLKPVSGGADALGQQVLRMPALLAPGTPLAIFAGLCGQDPAKGFDLQKTVGTRIRFTMSRVEK